MCDGIEDEAVGEELGVHILVAQFLSEVERLLVQYRHTLPVANPNTAGRSGGHMNECRTRCQTEVDTLFGTSNVDILDVGAFGEMLHIGGAVEDRVDCVIVASCNCVGEVAGDVAIDDKQAGAEEVVEAAAEVVEKEVTKTAFGIPLISPTHKTCDGFGFGVDELAQDMDAEKSGGTGKQYIA